MINQSILAEFMTSMSPTANQKAKEPSGAKSSGPKFEDFLSKASENKSGSPVTENLNQNAVHTYREAERNNNQNKVAVADRKSKIAANEGFTAKDQEKADDKKAVTDDVKAEAAVNALADILNISANDLKNILDSVNIQAKDLIDSSQINSITEKLSSLMDLNESQKSFLNEMLEQVKTQVDLSFSKTTDVQAPQSGVNEKLSEAGWVKVENVDLKVVKVDEKASQLKGLFVQLNQRLEELSNEAAQNKESLLDEIKASVEKAATALKLEADSPREVKIPVEEPTEAEIPKVENQPAQNAAGGSKDSMGSQQGSGEEKARGERSEQDKPSERAVKSEQAQVFQPVNKPDADNQNLILNPIAVDQAPKANELQGAFKLAQATVVSKDEILSQVIQKASVVTNGEKSEMVMDLKPDYLGKLSLKVVTENGIVMAKFIAENQRVKEVLETNMQLLKDSLEKQGLAVQGFSVSVGQDSARQSYGNGNTGQFANGKSAVWRNNPAASVITTEAVNSGRATNPYEWNSNQINLTA